MMLSVVLLIGGTTLRAQPAIGAAPDARVTVDAGVSRGVLPPTAFGMNTAAWDGHLLDPVVPALLSDAGVTMLRFPGGSTADNYHWQTNSMTPGGGYVNPSDTFDAFMGVARAAGAQPLITVNYGSNATGAGGGDPAEAAAWVNYANVTRGYGVTYWEIGNEVYGNGTYPNGWETDLHPQKGPSAYATNVVAFARAMKGVDPGVKVGVALTTPGYWPDGQSPDWNSTVLSTACSWIDFVDVHWYPQGTPSGTDAGLLASTADIGAMMTALQGQITRYCGADAAHIQILDGELNTGNAGKQLVGLPNALFLADSTMTWLENGAANAGWWNLHNGIDTSGANGGTLYGSAAYGDLGLLSSGGSSGATTEPPANTPFPPYYGMAMLTRLGRPGDTMVAATSDQGQVAVHAVRQAGGNLAILLVNKDPSMTYTVPLSLAGFPALSNATVYSYGIGSTGISTTSLSLTGPSFALSLPPYSLRTVVLQPAGPAPTPAPATATATSGALAVTITGASGPATPVAPGSGALLTATVLTSAGLAGAVVDFEVYNAAGNRVYQAWQSPVTLAPNTARTFTTTWTAPANQPAGAYRLKMGVFGSGWTPLYAWNDTSGTVVIGPPAATAAPSATAISPATESPTSLPAPATVTAQPSSSPSPTVTTHPSPSPSPTVTAHPSSSPSPSPTVTAQPSSSPSPTVTTHPSPSPTVTQAPVTATARPIAVVLASTMASAGMMSLGTTATFSATVSATAPLAGAIVDFQIYSPAGGLVAQVWQDSVTFGSPNTPVTVSAPWNIPTDLAPGTYTLKVGVFGPGWAPLYAWDNGSATFIVAPAITIPRSAAVVDQTGSGKIVALSAVVANNSNQQNVLVDFQIYNAAGMMIAQTWQSPVTLPAKSQQTVSAPWNIPPGLAPGTYTLKIGIFGPNWAPLYAWDNGSATFIVT